MSKTTKAKIYSQQVSVNDDGTIVPITVLLDELLEDILSRLPGKEQLKCRLVCRQWNSLLCSCPRLLRSSVGINLQLKRIKRRHWSRNVSPVKQIPVLEHPIIPILKANPALRVKKLTIMCSMFYVEECKTTWQDAVKFLVENGINSSVEVLHLRLARQPDIMTCFYSILSCLKKVKDLYLDIGALEIDEDEEENLQVFQFDKEWDTASFPSIKFIEIEPTGGQNYEIWTDNIYKIIKRFLSCMPNLQTIQGVFVYDKEFYDRYGHLLKMHHLEMDDTTFEIISARNLKLETISLSGSFDYDTKTYWQCLLESHPELKKIEYSYNTQSQFLPLEGIDYSKVTNFVLYLSPEPGNEQALSMILEHFPILEKLEVTGEIPANMCFFGHKIVFLPNLEKVEFYLKNGYRSCVECIDAMTKSFANVLDFEQKGKNLDILQSISENMTNLKSLKFQMETEIREDIFMQWPKMKNIEFLGFYTPVNSIKTEGLENLMQQCPKLKDVHFQNGLNITNN